MLINLIYFIIFLIFIFLIFLIIKSIIIGIIAKKNVRNFKIKVNKNFKK